MASWIFSANGCVDISFLVSEVEHFSIASVVLDKFLVIGLKLAATSLSQVCFEIF